MPFLASTQTIHHTNIPSAYHHGYHTPELSVSPLSLTHTFVSPLWPQPPPPITSATAPHPENLPFSRTTVFQALPSHLHHQNMLRPTWLLIQPGPWLASGILPPLISVDPVKLRHSGPQLHITPTATTSSSASAPGSENFAQGSCRTTETRSVQIYECMPANICNRILGLPEHPVSHILLAFF